MGSKGESSENQDDMELLRTEWKKMFQEILPTAATSVQPKWPVHVDHCFARIILDSTVGVDTPWMAKIHSPAYRHMSKDQLEASIQLGEKILNGEADLVELNKQSLKLRGKTKSGKLSRDEIKAIAPPKPKSSKRKAAATTTTEQAPPCLPPKKKPKTDDHAPARPPISKPSSPTTTTTDLDPDTTTDPSLAALITSSPTSSPFQKSVLLALLQVPRGHYTTYSLLSAHLSSNPRAVGRGLRNNPFAPAVPCHRVLATGGGIGGFKGSWGRKGEEGLNDGEKRRLLREEGIRFDGRGRVVGGPWDGWR